MSDYPKELRADFATLYFDYTMLKEFVTNLKDYLTAATQNHTLEIKEFCAHQDILNQIKTFENNNNIIFKNNLPDLKELED
jgi:hypothetical protein